VTDLKCSICGSYKIEKKFSQTANNAVFKCTECGTEFLFPQLSDGELKLLYSENYYKAWGLQGEHENEATKKMKMATFSLSIKLIQKYRPNGRLLDIGCATGYLLEVANQAGYETYGIEISEYSSTIAKKKFGDKNIFCGTLEECDFEKNFFDAITMTDLIEHVRNPQNVLNEAASLLKPGGILLITTPDDSTMSNKLFGKKWPHYKTEHFFYLNHKSIKMLADKCGFNLLDLEKTKKAITLKYLQTQFDIYKHWLFTPVIRFINKLLPNQIINRNFYFSMGEMTVVLRKGN